MLFCKIGWDRYNFTLLVLFGVIKRTVMADIGSLQSSQKISWDRFCHSFSIVWSGKLKGNRILLWASYKYQDKLRQIFSHFKIVWICRRILQLTAVDGKYAEQSTQKIGWHRFSHTWINIVCSDKKTVLLRAVCKYKKNWAQRR